MSSIQQIKVPDIGGAKDVTVIEVLVKPGDMINKDDSLITLESDKASMEVPSSASGKIKNIKVKIGDKISEGDVIVTLETEEAEKPKDIEKEATEVHTETDKKPQTKEEIGEIKVPDIGGAKDVTVIEVLVKPGDVINKDDSLITLESDKASMEIPSSVSGKIKDIKVKLGDKVSEGDVIATVVTEETETTKSTETQAAKIHTEEVAETDKKLQGNKEASEIKVFDRDQSPPPSKVSYAEIHAGPAVRRLARELGVDLTQVQGSGRKSRILIEDVHAFVKNALQNKGSGISVSPAQEIDFAKFGAVETKPLSRIQRLTGINVHRSWITVPHVTQFDEADTTELEAFRAAHKNEAEKLGFKLTPLIFLMKAVVVCLKKFPNFNSSLDAKGENLILKKYFNIGVAVDTPNGLVVPVIREVDQKGLYQLADELAKISKKAREKGLSLTEMQGSCFTISSLGGIGGTAFTPIVNATDVAILGVSKATMKPVYIDGQLVPRLMLPLSLSYDHRVIDGAEGARFTTYLSKLLGDIRQLLF